MKKEELVWTTEEGHNQHMSLFIPDNPLPNRPLVIYLHGFKGFKDWGFVPFTGQYFAEKGYHFLSVNFTHNGIGDDLLNFTELDKFKANTYSLELSEAEAVAAMAAIEGLGGTLPFTQIGLIGHSRGGGIALLTAARSPYIKAVATWAAVSDLTGSLAGMAAKWRAQGFLEVMNSRTGQMLHLGLELLEDIEAHQADKLNVLATVANCKKPICIIHGDEDKAVPLGHATNIYEADEWGQVELHIISGTGHTFGAKHPFAGTTPEFDEVLEYSHNFFENHLGENAN